MHLEVKVDYLFDGSLEGALTGVYQMFYAKAQVGQSRLLIEADYQPLIGRTICQVTTDADQADKVLKWILDTFGEMGFSKVTHAYLAEHPEYGTRLFEALKCAKRYGNNGLENLADQSVYALYDLYRKVVRASHLMLGLLRFMELENGVLYAPLDHEYALLPLMLTHFKNRLGNQVWVIHDVRRGMGAFYDGEDLFVNPLEKASVPKLSQVETAYQELWQSYFKHIAIDERKNPRQQRQMMPKKYWSYLVEKPMGGKR